MEREGEVMISTESGQQERVDIDRDLICYVHPSWRPLIRPAPAMRSWMDDTPASFAYRCLPMNIANSHGWEILNPRNFRAFWNGGSGVDACTIEVSDPTYAFPPVSIFGSGIITFNIEGIFRTPPGWNLFVGPSPNYHKDGIAALSGVIETDWSSTTFTMNWRFTRPGQWIEFAEQEPIGFLFPSERGAISTFRPRIEQLVEGAEPSVGFNEWLASRQEFQAKLAVEPAMHSSDGWQKHYYQGVDAQGRSHISDHMAKLRLPPFAGARDRPMSLIGETPDLEQADRGVAVEVSGGAIEVGVARPSHPFEFSKELAKRDWLLDTIYAHQMIGHTHRSIDRRRRLSSREFCERYYAANRPVVITDEMANWPAMELWTPAYLVEKIGDCLIEYQGDRSSNETFEIDKDFHKRTATFREFIESALTAESRNDFYITATNSTVNGKVFSALQGDVRRLSKYLTNNGETPDGLMWIGPYGTFTALHYDLTNNLLAQAVGRKRIILAPPSETQWLYNNNFVFSEVTDIRQVDLEKYPLISNVKTVEIVLEPGQLLFIPIGWWHQVEALDFSVTTTYIDFLWPNSWYSNFPA